MENIILEFEREVSILEGEQPIIREGSNFLWLVSFMQADDFEDRSDADNLHVHRLENLQVYPCPVCHANQKADCQLQECFVVCANLLKLCQRNSDGDDQQQDENDFEDNAQSFQKPLCVEISFDVIFVVIDELVYDIVIFLVRFVCFSVYNEFFDEGVELTSGFSSDIDYRSVEENHDSYDNERHDQERDSDR